MMKKVVAGCLAALSLFSLTAGQASASSVSAEDTEKPEETMISTYEDQFDQLTYEDTESGLSITYNLYLPEGYDETASYPMVVFIADSSCTGNDATRSLTQGLGALVWATDEWQETNPTIVAVPTYPETILDDHSGYTTTEYVELTKRFIDYMSIEYAVDTDRIYGTGQSMGCMTTLILASEYPDLYAACMLVDGQWDVSTLSGLEDQTFVYFAAEDDTSAWTGVQEVMDMFDKDDVEYTYAQWDGTWAEDELSDAAQELFAGETGRYFISWKTETIEAGAGNGENRFEKNNSFEKEERFDQMEDGEKKGPGNDGRGGMKGNGESGENGGLRENGGPEGNGGGASVHMASFDYAYNCNAVMKWLFDQEK